MIRVYIGGSFERQDYLREIAREVRAIPGIRVVSSWLDEPPVEGGATPPTHLARAFAKRDLDEISEADLLLLDTAEPSLRGGREFEAGYATGRGIEVIRVGQSCNVFHTDLPWYPNWTVAVYGLSLRAQALARTCE